MRVLTGRYQEMLEWGLEHSTDVRQIDLDVNRTFRNNIMFRDRYNVKQQELFRILVAYSVYNSVRSYLFLVKGTIAHFCYLTGDRLLPGNVSVSSPPHDVLA